MSNLKDDWEIRRYFAQQKIPLKFHCVNKELIEERKQQFSNLIYQNTHNHAKPCSQPGWIFYPTHYRIEITDYGYVCRLFDKEKLNKRNIHFETNFPNMNLRMQLKEIVEKQGGLKEIITQQD